MKAWVSAAVLALAFYSCSVSAKIDEQQYSFDYTALSEPSLRAITRDLKAESYRFLWQRPDGSGWSFRLAIDPQGGGRVIARRFITEAGQIKPEGQAKITEINNREVITFRAYLKIADFWRLNIEDEFAQASGNVWVLEGVQQGNYRWLKRFAPKDMYFRDAGLYLIELAGLARADFLVVDRVTQLPTG